MSDGTTAGTRLVKDIYPGPISSQPGFYKLASIGGSIFFVANDGSSGHELWKSDGTTEGTVLVKHIVPGASESLPNNLTAVGDTLFFGTSFPRQLWKSDGTAEGTVPLASGTAQNLTVIGERIFFRGSESEHGAELWSSDGTPEGTRMVVDLAPGATGSSPGSFAALDGQLYFLTSSAPATALWRSNGTAGGTTQVTTFSDLATDLTAALDQLFFKTRTAATGWELWESDGSAAGTHMLTEIVPGSTSSSPGELTPFDGRLFFAAFQQGRDLWTTDGTPGGTALVAEIDPFGHLGSKPQQLMALGSQLIFTAADTGVEHKLWSSDGTAEGTATITTTMPFRLAVAGGAAYFISSDSNQSQIWRTNGSPAGTTPVSMTAKVNNSALLFTVDERVLYVDAYALSREIGLWRSDATGETMQWLGTLPPSSSIEIGATIHDVETVGDAVFLLLDRRQGEGVELWRADSSPSSPVRLTRARIHSDLAQIGGQLLFGADDDTGPELWTSDGTVTGTVRLADLNPGAPASNPYNFTVRGDEVYFSAEDGVHGRELWRSDGTATGTRLVSNAVPGPVGAEPSLGVPAGDVIYYTAQDLAHGRELWKSDGTAAGTAMVRDIMPGLSGSLPQAFQAVPGGIVFAASDGASGLELWRSAGTSESTALVQDIVPGPANSNPQELTVAGDRLFFSAEGEGDGRELWSAPLAELFPPPPPPPPTPPALSLNYERGRPGSAFLVTGAGFAPGAALTLRVKGVALGSVTSDGSGAFTALLRTAPRSPAGEYSVLVTPEGSTTGALAATAAYTLDPAAPLREAPAAPVTFETLVPADLETLQLRVYLPGVAR